MASDMFTPDIRDSRFDIKVLGLISEFLKLISDFKTLISNMETLISNFETLISKFKTLILKFETLISKLKLRYRSFKTSISRVNIWLATLCCKVWDCIV